MDSSKKKIKPKKIILLLCIALLCAVIAGIWYLGDYYRADAACIEVFAAENFMDYSVEPQISENHNISFEPEGAKVGLIFYPGGKVEYTAYTPLMNALASNGILCVLVEMPFHLAVLDSDAAAGIQAQYPEIETWYIGGHSLGGSMAAAYLSDCEDTFAGLILLGSYAAADLSDTDLSVLSIYGSEDMVLNKENYEKNKINLPEDFTEIVLDGGCHAYFGMYGPQEGDGTPAITNEEQIKMTSDAICAFTMAQSM